MSEIGQKIVVSVVSAIAVALLTLLSSKVRSALFYKRVEYDLAYSKGLGPVQWDIEWEGFRLTISADDVSNDRLDNVKVERNERSPFVLSRLEPSDTFRSLFNGEIEMKLNSIVRRKANSEIDYVLRFVFRRRWLQIA